MIPWRRAVSLVSSSTATSGCPRPHPSLNAANFSPLPPGSCVTALFLDREEDRDRLAIAPARASPLVVGVVGASGSGKTAVIADLVRKLAVNGVRAVAVKHAAHGFALDREGSDSARMAEAGAALVLLAGPAESLVRIAAPLRDPDRATALAAFDGVWCSRP